MQRREVKHLAGPQLGAGLAYDENGAAWVDERMLRSLEQESRHHNEGQLRQPPPWINYGVIPRVRS